jgi:cytochrome oxidase assembly protein ShyY1
VLFAIATTLLSWWQFSRREERVQRIELVLNNYDSTPLSFGEVKWEIDPATKLATLEWHPVILEGNYLPDKALLVRNRPLSGTPGFLQLVPFALKDGSVVMVERGWLPAASDITQPLTNPLPTDASRTLIVRLRQSEPDLGRKSVAGQLDSIDLLEAQAINPELAIETRFYGRLVNESPASERAPIAMPKPSVDEGNHLSYALQWLLFGIMALAAFIWAYRNDRRIRLEEAGLAQPKVKKRTQADDDASFEDQNQ